MSDREYIIKQIRKYEDSEARLKLWVGFTEESKKINPAIVKRQGLSEQELKEMVKNLKKLRKILMLEAIEYQKRGVKDHRLDDWLKYQQSAGNFVEKVIRWLKDKGTK